MAVFEQDRLLHPGMKQPGTKHQRSFMQFLAASLSRRPHARRPGTHWSDNSSAFLNHILDACGITTTADRLAGFEALFAMMDVRGASSPDGQGAADFVLQNLRSWNDMPMYSPNSRWTHHLLPASIALRAAHVYEPLLDGADPRVLSTRLKRPSKVFGSPLAAAVASGLPDVVRAILAQQPDLLKRSPTALLSVAAAAAGEPMVSLLLGYELPAHWSLHEAIVRCAVEGRVGCARTLLRFVLGTAQRPHVDVPHALQEGLHAACVRADRDMARCFLEHGADLNANIDEDLSRVRRASTESRDSNSSARVPVRPPPVTLAAWAADDDFMGWLVAQGAALSGSFTDMSPIYGAIIGDRAGILEALVKMGADSHWSQFDWADALYLCVEVHANRCLRYLLGNAKVIDMSAVDLESDDLDLCGLVEKLCKYGNVEAFEILVAAGMAMDKPFRGIATWTAMLVAQSYGSPEAREIVARLEAMGMKRYEVSEMPHRERFESGEWPRRGSRSVSSMPHSMELTRRAVRSTPRAA